MKSNGGEKILRELFHKARTEVERTEPPFRELWHAAADRVNSPRSRPGLVIKALGLTMVAALTIFVLLRPGTQREVNTQIAPQVSPPQQEPTTVQPTAVSTLLKENTGSWKKRRSGSGPGSAKHLQPVIALSEWRSPTESLLRSPGEWLLRSTPAAFTAIDEIKPLLEQRNN